MAVVYMAVVYVVLTVLAGYFLGCVNGALLVSKYILHDDVRDHGSGNAGLTNFHRVFGGKLTIVVVLCDMLKAVCAVLVGQLLMGHFLGLVVLGKYVAGLSCMLGHMFPCMFRFKGRQGDLVRRDHRHYARLAHRPGGVGPLPCAGRPDPHGVRGFSGCRCGLCHYDRRSLPQPAGHDPGIVIGILVVWGHRSNIGRNDSAGGNTLSPAP